VLFSEFRKLGYIEGRNLIVERYSAEGRPERYPDIAQEVARTRPDVILAITNLLVSSLQAATDTIPIVGLVAELRPPGNGPPNGRHRSAQVTMGCAGRISRRRVGLVSRRKEKAPRWRGRQSCVR
jgi:hypothetical protein